MLINERIRLIIKANNLNPSAFAEIVGINKSSLSHVLSGRNKPGLDFLEKVLNNFPNVNASWLITGETREGDFKPESKKQVSNEASKEIEYIAVFYTDGTFKRYSSEEDAAVGK